MGDECKQTALPEVKVPSDPVLIRDQDLFVFPLTANECSTTAFRVLHFIVSCSISVAFYAKNKR